MKWSVIDSLLAAARIPLSSIKHQEIKELALDQTFKSSSSLLKESSDGRDGAEQRATPKYGIVSGQKLITALGTPIRITFRNTTYRCAGKLLLHAKSITVQLFGTEQQLRPELEPSIQ